MWCAVISALKCSRWTVSCASRAACVRTSAAPSLSKSTREARPIATVWRRGDVVVEMNGSALENQPDFLQRIAYRAPGDTVAITVVRDGKEIALSITLAERPSEESILAGGNGARRPRPREEREDPSEDAMAESLGVGVSELTPRYADRLSLDDDYEGVVIVAVQPNSIAARSGLSEGDVIRRVGSRRISSVAEFEEAMAGYAAGDAIDFYVRLVVSGRSAFISMRLPNN